jgi:hypothetical protein
MYEQLSARSLGVTGWTILPNIEFSAARCRELAAQYKDRATQTGLAAKRATLLRNISRSLTSLASQLEMLVDDMAAERRRQLGREH